MAGAQREAIVEALAGRVLILFTSATTGEGVADVVAWCRNRTTVLVGSSGVGKSTLTNVLLGRSAQATATTRKRDDEGRHTTRRRELFVLPGGGTLVDTPGMREFGVWGDPTDQGPRRGR